MVDVGGGVYCGWRKSSQKIIPISISCAHLLVLKNTWDVFVIEKGNLNYCLLYKVKSDELDLTEIVKKNHTLYSRYWK